MKILITGANGFIGQNLLKELESQGKFSRNDIVLLTSRLIEGYTCIDHKSYSYTFDDFLAAGFNVIDLVIHLGAFTPKSGAEANDISKSISNITNTAYLLNHLPSLPKKIIFISSVDVYKFTNKIISENSEVNPETLYGLSKLMCERIVLEYAKEKKITCQILRLGHIYGVGEQGYQKIIPITIQKLLNNEHPIIFSKGFEKRSFLYVNDCCSAIIKSIDLNEYIGPVNVVSKNATSILEIIDILIKISGKEISSKVLSKDISVHDMSFSNEKMEKYLVKESTSLVDGLRCEYEYFTDLNKCH